MFSVEKLFPCPHCKTKEKVVYAVRGVVPEIENALICIECERPNFEAMQEYKDKLNAELKSARAAARYAAKENKRGN